MKIHHQTIFLLTVALFGIAVAKAAETPQNLDRLSPRKEILQNTNVNSPYGWRLATTTMHNGIDLNWNNGKPDLYPIVWEKGWKATYKPIRISGTLGNVVELTNGSTTFLYCHLSEETANHYEAIGKEKENANKIKDKDGNIIKIFDYKTIEYKDHNDPPIIGVVGGSGIESGSFREDVYEPHLHLEYTSKKPPLTAPYFAERVTEIPSFCDYKTNGILPLQGKNDDAYYLIEEYTEKSIKDFLNTYKVKIRASSMDLESVEMKLSYVFDGIPIGHAGENGENLIKTVTVTTNRNELRHIGRNNGEANGLDGDWAFFTKTNKSIPNIESDEGCWAFEIVAKTYANKSARLLLIVNKGKKPASPDTPGDPNDAEGNPKGKPGQNGSGNGTRKGLVEETQRGYKVQ